VSWSSPLENDMRELHQELKGEVLIRDRIAGMSSWVKKMRGRLAVTV